MKNDLIEVCFEEFNKAANSRNLNERRNRKYVYMTFDNKYFKFLYTKEMEELETIVERYGLNSNSCHL